MTLILPGVEITVVKEIVVPQLNPAGILGLIGICEEDEEGNTKPVARETSFKGFKGIFGRSIDFTVPEAKQAFQNGVSEVCMVPVAAAASQKAKLELKGGKGNLVLQARAKGVWANGVKIKVQEKLDDDDKKTLNTMILNFGMAVEFFDNLTMDPKSDRYIVKVINAGSDLVTAIEPKNPLGVPLNDFEGVLAGGTNCTLKDYDEGLEALEAEEDVDLVVASIQDYTDPKFYKQIYANIDAHCKVMNMNCMNRIGFGEVPPSSTFKNALEETNYISKLTNTLASDQFVLIAPHGALGAVVGLIGNLPVHHSPTWKSLTGLTELERNYSPSQLMQMLKSRICLLEIKKGKGIIVEKGICTSGEQISVQRVADRSVRGTKMIGDLFIGTLNNMTGRAALKEKITEFFIQFEKDGCIVPSADGSDPAYKVDVYATDDDIGKGIVRVDIAIRPVRAIDYIYGTILVRA